MTHAVSYFGAGPAKLPASVLQQAAEAALDYNRTGISMLELPHRSKTFKGILSEANELVRELCGLADDFELLWLQGGGRLQFAMVPANFLGNGAQAGYIDSGHWASDAWETARIYGDAAVLSSGKENNYLALPNWPTSLPEKLSYLHCTPNNTIYGTQWDTLPATEVPLVADLSSDIFSRHRNYHDFSMFYAVAQKNFGPAGVTLVAIRKDFLKAPVRSLPPYLNYAAHIAAGGILNTVPVYPIYVCLLYLRWLKEKTLAVQILENRQKAGLLYDALDNSSYFRCPLDPKDRSLMNVVFQAKDTKLEQLFLKQCLAAGLQGLEGHRSVGGFRASLYNAVSLTDVNKLVAAIKNFQP